LALINLMTTWYPWFLWPALGWGFGLFSHFMGVFGSRALKERYFDPAVERELQREKAVMQTEKQASLGELSSTIAHEIRNPIAAAKSLVQQMGEDPQSVENVEYAKVALAELDRVERRIAHLLKFAKEEDYVMAPANLAAVVDSALTQMRGKLDAARVAAVRNYIVGPTVVVDAEKLKQVFANVLDNAIDAFDGVPENRRIELFIENGGNDAVVRIRDNGSGIPSDKLDRIFNPFFTTKEKGTGLGMAISKKIVEAHAGTMEAASEVGRGTEFLVSLPLPRRRYEGTHPHGRRREGAPPGAAWPALEGGLRGRDRDLGRGGAAAHRDRQLPPRGDRPEHERRQRDGRPRARPRLRSRPRRDHDHRPWLGEGRGAGDEARGGGLHPQAVRQRRAPGGGPPRDGGRAAATRPPPAPRASARRLRLRAHHRRQPGDASAVRDHRPDRRHGRDGAHPGRERDGQGAGGERAALSRPATRQADGEDQLRRAQPRAGRERALRARARRLHGRARTARGEVRGRRRRHAAARRVRRHAARDPGEAPAGAAGEGVRARRRQPADPRRRARAGRHQPGPRSGGARRPLPRGPVLSPAGHRAGDPAARGAPPGTPAPPRPTAQG